MGQHTNIQWCDSTCNCTAGCCGCELWIRGKGGSCYAGAIHTRFSPSKSYPGSFDEISLHPGRMAQAAKWSDLRGKKRPDKPWLDGQPRIVFVSDMSDALSPGIPFEFLKAEIVDNVSSDLGKRHIWMWLTKFPKRMVEFSRWLETEHRIFWPANLWAGTSVTSDKTTGRIADLMDVRARIHFVSAEPLWGEIDLNRRELLCKDYPDGITIGKYLDLVIVGGESGPQAKPMDVEWVRSLIQQCRETNTAAFCKQLGAKPYEIIPESSPWEACNRAVAYDLNFKDSHGGNWNEWPADLKVRQFPTV